MSQASATPMPALSESLQHPFSRTRCQSCGMENPLRTQLWMECDEQDGNQMVGIGLCRDCSDKLIDPHPRLYKQVDPLAPFPGLMELCTGCKHRGKGRCLHPLLKANGGSGLPIEYPKPSVAHVSMMDRRQNHWRRIYPGPPTSCKGREQSNHD